MNGGLHPSILPPSSSFLLTAFLGFCVSRLGKVTGAVVELEVLLFENRIHQLNLNPAIGTVFRLVRWRVRNQVLFAKVLLNLSKSITKV